MGVSADSDSSHESPATPQIIEIEELDPYYLYRLRVEARAAGIDKAEFSKTTLTEINIAIEGKKVERAYGALPIIDYQISQLSDKDLDEMQKRRESNKPPHFLRAELKESYLKAYAPAYWFLKSIKKGDAIEGMPPSVARGILEAVRSGVFQDPRMLMQISRIDRDLRATVSQN